jgi:hypothetical protein
MNFSDNYTLSEALYLYGVIMPYVRDACMLIGVAVALLGLMIAFLAWRHDVASDSLPTTVSTTVVCVTPAPVYPAQPLQIRPAMSASAASRATHHRKAGGS